MQITFITMGTSVLKWQIILLPSYNKDVPDKTLSKFDRGLEISKMQEVDIACLYYNPDLITWTWIFSFRYKRVALLRLKKGL
jgi:hypothetical protein